MTNLIQQGLALRELLRERILILDGAMGTMLQQANLTAEDFGGPELEGCNENLVMTRPDVVLEIHRKYLHAGADIIETNSFGSTPVVLAEYGLGEEARRISRVAAELARKAADGFSTAGKPRFVAGSMGPTTRAISVTGGITFEQLRNNYYEQASGLMEGGADILLLETCQDTRNIKAGLLAIQRIGARAGPTGSADGFGDDRGDGHDAGGARRRGVVGFAGSRGSNFAGIELRYRAGIHDGPCAHAAVADESRGFLLSERGFAERRRVVSGDADISGGAAGEIY